MWCSENVFSTRVVQQNNKNFCIPKMFFATFFLFYIDTARSRVQCTLGNLYQIKLCKKKWNPYNYASYKKVPPLKNG